MDTMTYPRPQEHAEPKANNREEKKVGVQGENLVTKGLIPHQFNGRVKWSRIRDDQRGKNRAVCVEQGRTRKTLIPVITEGSREVVRVRRDIRKNHGL